jgi:hypothetical protein
MGETPMLPLPDVSLKVADAFGADVFRFAGMSHVGPLMSTRAREVARQSLEWIAERFKSWRAPS